MNFGRKGKGKSIFFVRIANALTDKNKSVGTSTKFKSGQIAIKNYYERSYTR